MTGAEFFKELCERAQDGAAMIEEVRDGVLEDVVDNKVVPRLMHLAKQQERETFPATINFVLEDAIHALASKRVFAHHEHARFSVFNRIQEHTQNELGAKEEVASFMRGFKVVADDRYGWRVVNA